jgi:hypothetical protein
MRLPALLSLVHPPARVTGNLLRTWGPTQAEILPSHRKGQDLRYVGPLLRNPRPGSHDRPLASRLTGVQSSRQSGR